MAKTTYHVRLSERERKRLNAIISKESAPARTIMRANILLTADENNAEGIRSARKITEHLLCFWSAEEEKYQKAKRGLLDEKIAAFIEKPSLLDASNSFGIKKYFKKVLLDKQTGEVLKAKEQYVFNQEQYERDLALDGYYCIVTNDLSLAPLDIIKHYHELS